MTSDLGQYTHVWHSAKYCEDFYPGQIINGVDVSNEFPSKTWICPDVDTITILNSPELYTLGNGTQFTLVVNDCASA